MLFRSYRKRKALESYRHVLGPKLRATWGRKEHYTPEEVVVTATTYHLSNSFLCYGLAMYCDRESFDRYHHEQGDAACSYVRLRNELNSNVTLGDGSTSFAAVHDANDHDASAADASTDLGGGTDTSCDTGSGSDAGVDAGGFDGGCDGGGGGGD